MSATDRITPDDVAKMQFTTRWLRPGYDETEVDDFLDEIEAQMVADARTVAEVVGMCRSIAAGTHKDFPRNAKPARVARAVLAKFDPKPPAVERLPDDQVKAS